MDISDIPLGKLSATYIKIRTAKQQLQDEYDTKIEALAEQMALVSNAMKDILLAQKATSMKTEAGTVILSTQTRRYPTDWDEFNKFVLQHEALFLFEKRIHQGNMEKFLQDNPDDPPPGLNSDTNYVISVRKS
jgi:hypothetical protein